MFAGYTASFACLVAERRALGRPPTGRSMCRCGRTIPMWRNIPMVSWLLQRGRAACCGAQIPAWYVVAEAATVAASLAGAAVAGWPLGLAATALAAAAIVVGHHLHSSRTGA